MLSEILKYLVIAIGSYSVYLVLEIIFPPFNFPKTIPTIPFYVSFLGSYENLDQEQIYKRYLKDKLEKYGAVKIYFASRWNILVSRPEYLLTIFKNEDVYAKSGNHIKIPGSVMASYTGDNIISAHGELWKLYREVVAPSIQFPDKEPVYKNTKMMLEIIENELKNSDTIAIADILQRYTLNNVGNSMIGIDFRALEGSQSFMHQKIKYVKSQIFRPFYMNFPYFDKFPIPSRLTAKREVNSFRNWYGQKLIDEHKPELSNSAATKLVNALKDGKLTEKQYLDNAVIVMVAGHENPLLLMLSVLFILGKNPDLQESLRTEKIPLESVIYETLRVYPPLAQIINRCTTKATVLGENIFIPKGVYVGYNNLATGRDRGIWGPDADEFNPSRWGNTLDEINQNYSQAKRMATLPAFHGRKRACLGEKFAIFEIKECISAIIGKYRISLGENWKPKLTPSGPVCPLGLQIKFEKA
ncbi:Dit2 protein [Spathaspora passalidarum NRRL Y-27907]|uniref:Dit2 protein n=1 Tax=Spathaspora passalidarum (strain NRRL Y-27907 / 11-Y1) TaxID=619300 RepID=G3AHJ0_SPAPN|nr:Dit2 protein [Spathaspora passalidarum NRRL Y-27907]EGW34154.1 Dit2 protein [Spathaspora passalidarum NRRL Y-27907]